MQPCGVHTISGRLSVLLSVMASWLWTGLRTPSPKEKNSPVNKVREVAHARKWILYRLWITFSRMVGIGLPEITIHANFGDSRLRGSRVAWAQMLPFHIDFHRRPYNAIVRVCDHQVTSVVRTDRVLLSCVNIAQLCRVQTISGRLCPSVCQWWALFFCTSCQKSS